jgi:hypothetical protein
MEREDPDPSNPTSNSQHHNPALPPWEVRSVAQVPFMERAYQTTTWKDEQGASRPTPHVNHRPTLSTTTSAPCGADYSSPLSERSSSMPWRSTTKTPSNSVPVEPSYETPVYQGSNHDRPAYEDPSLFKPALSKTASQPPSNHPSQVPPTPPESVSWSSLRSASASPPSRPISKALPGTMSSREGHSQSAPVNKTKATGCERWPGRRQAKQDQTGLGKRVKSAFRDIFRKDPVDDSQFERISDRHWTDEY